MKARKFLRMFVIALCLWLPLQSVAGQWLHCVQLPVEAEQFSTGTKKFDNETVADRPSESVKKTAPSSFEIKIPPCHQINETFGDDVKGSSINNDATCEHCKLFCNWHCTLQVSDLVTTLVDLVPYGIPYKSASPAQPWLSQPQKPPQALFI